jgi:hypothetical protein
LRNGHLPDVRARRGLRFHYGKHGFRHSIPKYGEMRKANSLF